MTTDDHFVGGDVGLSCSLQDPIEDKILFPYQPGCHGFAAQNIYYIFIHILLFLIRMHFCTHSSNPLPERQHQTATAMLSRWHHHVFLAKDIQGECIKFLGGSRLKPSSKNIQTSGVLQSRFPCL